MTLQKERQNWDCWLFLIPFSSYLLRQPSMARPKSARAESVLAAALVPFLRSRLQRPVIWPASAESTLLVAPFPADTSLPTRFSMTNCCSTRCGPQSRRNAKTDLSDRQCNGVVPSRLPSFPKRGRRFYILSCQFRSVPQTPPTGHIATAQPAPRRHTASRIRGIVSSAGEARQMLALVHAVGAYDKVKW